ncbi:amylo-alpha-1,6-glucosidase [Oharaeibacter diazotrophicus]|uniref:Glycogen debranching enzyme n=3 Tax=Oharaeibacter diazotrophicus TaxID=1920512 RepID=A0A4R6RAH7_9HYPH|nr:glycogen debranching N-terminal domain-containing protein [Oharaeibacter diazotrophicus]TDP83100.1 glycogen debranching enzyme [Oharaeibacter diazotrophicus]BBE71931.1 amylo-alpha-1,6-glucosidase [Pleomorphomonas sp. SM30]GLS78694.1 amylo-alpha-1,6-glucosidase [Oharaeibacter diazotrophicus]
MTPMPNLRAADVPTEPDYAVAASGPVETDPRTLKHDDTFAVFDTRGDAVPGAAHGMIHRDVRHLSMFMLTIAGVRPLPLSSTVRDDNGTLTCDLTNPDLPDPDGLPPLTHGLVHLRRSRFLHRAACHESLAVRNFDVRPRRVEIALAFGADFVDLFEIRGARRLRRGTTAPPLVGADTVALAYTGLDDRTRRTTLRFEPAPDTLAADRATFRMTLAPGETRVVFVEIRCDGAPPALGARLAFRAALQASRTALRLRLARAAAVTTSNGHFDEGLRRAAADLAMLVTDKPDGPYPYAGVPWFSTVFGRDAIVTAFETLWSDPAIARGVLFHLAANQATAFDPTADAEPGKILHEVRYGEMAELGEVPFRRYYGSVDSTPLFVMLAGAFLERTGDVAAVRVLWPAVEAAIGWIVEHGDRDGDGFVEYGRRSGDGLVNQGWKDSHDSVFHADGELARGPIAIVEVQAYAFAAFRAAAAIARALDQGATAARLDARADALADAFDAAFFDPGLGTYVLALDGEKRPCRVRSSNAGHALFAGIARPDRAAAVADGLTGTAGHSGWGIRTIAAGEARYNPMSYHNGSVWPHDNALIALGLSRYGHGDAVARVFEGLFRASVYFDVRRMPELFCGFARMRSQGPVAYPVACAPQAWAAAAPLALLQASLGLTIDAAAGRAVFRGPHLPDFLDVVTIRGLAVGRGSLDVEVRRVRDGAAVSVLERRGEVGVTVET